MITTLRYFGYVVLLLWGEEDSNLRRLSQQIYSLPHLTALVSPQNNFNLIKN